MRVQVLAEPFSPWQCLADYEREVVSRHNHGSYGACASFVGTMRNFNEGDAVIGMFLEHYPGMTEKSLQQLAEQAQMQFQLQDVLIVHRVGQISPAEPIVLVACWSAHRKQAFEATRELMEWLKHQAPFWKKEQLVDGSRWVSKNTPGY